jgi:hypothetical protein
VTILAILDFLGAGLSVLIAIAGFLGATFLAALISQAGRGNMGAGLGAAIGAAFGVAALIGAAISALLGWGMWSLKEWARILQIVFAGLGACVQALGLLVSLTHMRVFGMMWNLVWLAVNAFIIYYLIQPQVKAAFAQRPVVGYAPPAPPAAGAGR